MRKVCKPSMWGNALSLKYEQLTCLKSFYYRYVQKIRIF
jgi:hypothetical protein